MPAFSLAAAAIAKITFSMVVSWVVKSLVLVGVNMLATKLLAPKNTGAGKQTDPGVRQMFTPATLNKLNVVYGSAYLGGAITDAYMTSDNQVMWYCIALSEKTGTIYSTSTASEYSFGDIYLGNNLVTFRSDGITVDYTTDTTGGQDKNPSGLIQIYLYKNGSTAPTLPVGYTGTVPGNAYDVWAGGGVWTTANRMEGCAFALIKVTYNRDKNVTGLPEPQFELINTMKMPGDVFYDYATNNRYGAGIATTEIDTASVAAWNTYSAESVTYNGTETLPDRYQLNGIVRTTEDCLSNLERITSSAGSWLTYDIGTGLWGVVINKARGVTVDQTFTDSDILGEITLAGTALDSLYNSVEARFPHRDLRDQSDVRVIKLAAEDRNINEPDNTLNLELDLCNEPVQAEILASLELDSSRLEQVVVFSTDYSKIQTEAGDIIAIYNDAYGWNAEGGYADGKDFRVLRVVESEGEQGQIVVQITAKEYYDVYNPGALTRPPVLPDTGIVGGSVFGIPAAPVAEAFVTNMPSIFNLTAVVPTGNFSSVTNLQFYATTDFSAPTDEQNYFLVGTSNIYRDGINSGDLAVNQGRGLVQGATIILADQQLPLGSYRFKVRCVNSRGTGEFSDPSEIFVWSPTSTALGPNNPVRVSCSETLPWSDYLGSSVGNGVIDFGGFAMTGGNAGGASANAAVNFSVAFAGRRDIPRYNNDYTGDGATIISSLSYTKDGNTADRSAGSFQSENINYLPAYPQESTFRSGRAVYGFNVFDPATRFNSSSVGYAVVDYTPDRNDGCQHGLQIVKLGTTYSGPHANVGNVVVAGGASGYFHVFNNLDKIDLYNKPQITSFTKSNWVGETVAYGANTWVVVGGSSNNVFDDARLYYNAGNAFTSGSWTAVTPATGGRLMFVDYDGTNFAALGNYDTTANVGTVYYSATGSTWTASGNSFSSTMGITALGGGNSGKMFASHAKFLTLTKTSYGPLVNSFAYYTALSSVAITSAVGEFSCSAAGSTLVVGQRIRISGTLSGSGNIYNYSDPTFYWIIATNGSTTFQLSATRGGTPLSTTAGTTTGWTFQPALPRTSVTTLHTTDDNGVNWYEITGDLIARSTSTIKYSSAEGAYFIAGEYYPTQEEAEQLGVFFYANDYRTLTAGTGNIYSDYNKSHALKFTTSTVDLSFPTGYGIFAGNFIVQPYTGSTAARVYTGMPVTVSGTLGGTATISGYTSPTTYYAIFVAMDANYQYIKLATTPANARAGTAVTTTNGTLTGLTFNIPTITKTFYNDANLADVTINTIAVLK